MTQSTFERPQELTAEVPHVLAARQYDADQLEAVFDRSEFMRDRLLAGDAIACPRPHGKNAVATVFYEPSTRTRLSFEAAAEYLHLPILSTENAGGFSSAVKGETLEDSIRVLAGYAGAIVLRHNETGAAARAAAVSNVPILNAGDGKGEHPTQSLLDMYTIRHETGRLDNLDVVIGGDLAYGRTARSLAQTLSLFPGNRIQFVSAPQLRIGEDVKNYLRQQGTEFNETSDMYEPLAQADVVYWTRTQLERHDKADAETQGGNDEAEPIQEYVLGQAALRLMKPEAIIMHPLPRVDEIEASVDNDPRAAYFRQAENGLYVRMALLDMTMRSTAVA